MVAAINRDDDGETVGAFQKVSVAFIDRCRRTKMTEYFSLFDTGSPISCVRRSLVPFALKEKRTVTPYRGIGKNRISSYGQIECKILRINF